MRQWVYVKVCQIKNLSIALVMGTASPFPRKKGDPKAKNSPGHARG
jgi:hypothetical protein